MPYRSTDRLCRRGAPVNNLSQSGSIHSLEKIAPSNSGIKHLSYKIPLQMSRQNTLTTRRCKLDKRRRTPTEDDIIESGRISPPNFLNFPMPGLPLPPAHQHPLVSCA